MANSFQNDPLEAAQAAYSPLPVMVQRFRDTFGPRPAPTPPPNLEQQSAAQEQDRGPFNWANNALPPGSPYPRTRAFQPFTPASIPRPSHQWGQPEQFPNLPQSFEVPALAQGLSRFFGQNGSFNVAQLAMGMGPHAAEFLAGVQQGMTERAKMAREQLALKAAQLAQTQQEELTRYADVMSAHGALNETTDPTKMLKPVNGKSLLEDLHDTAAEIGDIGKPGTLGNLIEAGASVSEIDAFLKLRDNRLRDLQKMKSTVDEDTASEAAWGLPQKPATSYIGAYPREPGATPAAPPAGSAAAVDPSTGQPAPAPAPSAGDKVAGPGAPSTPDEAAPKESPIDAMTTDVVRTEQAPDATFAKKFPEQYQAIMLNAARQKAAVLDLIRNPPKDRSQIMPMLKKINPVFENDAQQVMNYGVPASGGTSGTGASLGSRASQYGDMIRNVVTLAAGTKPDGTPIWNQGFFQDQQRFRNDVQTRTVLLRTKDLAPMAERLNNDLTIVQADLKKRGISPNDVNLDGIIRMFANDPKYVALHTDFIAYNDAYNTIVSGGRHTIGGTRLQTEAISPYAPLATYRNVIKGHMYGVTGMIDGEMDHWVSIGGKRTNMPDFDTPESMAVLNSLRGFRDMDYVTGKRPGEIVTHNGVKARWTGKNPTDRNAPENWEPVD